MSYRSHTGESREFWARVFGASYLKTGSWTLKALCEATGLTNEASNERLRRWAGDGKPPPAATINRFALALGIPVQELMALIPAEDEDEAVEANLTERYVHGNCA
jgi:transcriptional regulator with XRE-family HTH domain